MGNHDARTCLSALSAAAHVVFLLDGGRVQEARDQRPFGDAAQLAQDWAVGGRHAEESIRTRLKIEGHPRKAELPGVS